jgi:hypothetical protein
VPQYSPARVSRFSVDVDSGEEWHSDPYDLKEGDQVTLSCRGDGKFYAGIFDREDYFDKRGSEAGAFGFEFGEDDRGFTDRFEVPNDDEYYIVFRVGVFTVGPVHIDVRLKIERE